MKLIKLVATLALMLTLEQKMAAKKTTATQTTHNLSPIIYDLENLRTVSLCRLALLPGILATICFMHKDTIIKTIYDRPISFLAISYLVGNYMIDTISKYQKIHRSLRFLILSHSMNRYMLCAFAIKNNEEQQQKSLSLKISDKVFFQKITDMTGYTLEELEFLTTHLTSQSLIAISDISSENYSDQSDDHLYFLLKEKITIDQIMATCKHETTLRTALELYLQDPEGQHDLTMETIGNLIKQQINSFVKKNLHVFLPA